MTRRSRPEARITGHYFDKHKSRSPLARLLVGRYRRALHRIVSDLPVSSALEIGSGEGHILAYVREVRPDVRLVGSDIGSDVVRLGRAAAPFAGWCVANGARLPFAARCADLLLACEVLEHVSQPEAVMSEMRRLARRYCLVSVPNEPLWRVLNVARGRYLRSWGDTPGHVQHWSRSGIVSLVGRHADVQAVVGVLPWIFVLAGVG